MIKSIFLLLAGALPASPASGLVATVFPFPDDVELHYLTDFNLQAPNQTI
jgi:hypothetical protein